MSAMTQEQFDTEVDKLVAHIHELSQDHESVQMAIAMGNKELLASMSIYELDILPAALEAGLKAQTLTELLGFEISIKEKK